MAINPNSTRRRNSVPSSEAPENSEADLQLFETPADLLCPITHELFYEPVINAAGQVYERRAIEKALSHRLVDPISNAPLETSSLTTVWPMKSKAAAYRERAVRGCIAQVCRLSCRSPIRYLRRAAELSANAAALADPSGAVLGLPGLTQEVVDYVLTHPSYIYDFQALGLFAASLKASGHSEMAAGIYTKLLHLGGDSSQQVEALQGLLECWGGADGDDDDEQKLVERLAALSCREGPEGCRPARFVGILLAAGLPEEVVLRFCEYILGSGGGGLGQVSLSAAAGCSGKASQGCGVEGQSGGCGGAGAASTVTGGPGGYADLLYVYTKLRCGQLASRLACCQAAVEDVAAGGSGRGNVSEAAVGRVKAEGPGRRSGSGVGRRLGLHMLKRGQVQRAVCSVVYALVSLTGSNRPVLRVLKVASVLLLLNTHKPSTVRR